MSTHLLIDLSYYVFYRYYALINYIHLSTKEVPNLENIIENEPFLTKFAEMLEKSFLVLLKKHCGVKKNKCEHVTVYMVKDCARANIWRQAIFSEYKSSRDLVKKKYHFDGMIFEYVYKTIIPMLMQKYPFVHICSHGVAEADDIIAVMTDCLQGNEIIVITNDHDYLQLLDKVTKIYNLQGKDLSLKAVEGPSNKNMMLKVLQGDPSDNIKGIMTKSKSLNLVNQHSTVEEIETAFLKNASAVQMERYKLNKQLIDFENIPVEIVREIKEMFYNHTPINCSACVCKSSIVA